MKRKGCWDSKKWKWKKQEAVERNEEGGWRGAAKARPQRREGHGRKKKEQT